MPDRSAAIPWKQVLLEQLLAQPYGDRHAEGPEAAGSERKVRLQQALELQERLVVESDVVDLLELEVPFGKAVLDGVHGKTRIVLLARKALFLRSRRHRPVHEERGCAVVVIRGDPQDAHRCPEAV